MNPLHALEAARQALKAAQKAGKAVDLPALVEEVFPGANLDDMLKLEALRKPSKEEPMVRIYHGGGEGQDELLVEDRGLFEGLFGSLSRESAESHGLGDVYFIDIPEKDLLTHDDLWQSGYTEFGPRSGKEIDQALRDIAPWADEDRADDLYRIVVEDKYDDDLAEGLFPEAEMPVDIMMLDDEYAKNSFFSQYLRGKLAQRLGYKAVDMNDEHGVSTFILPGQKLIRSKGSE